MSLYQLSLTCGGTFWIFPSLNWVSFFPFCLSLTMYVSSEQMLVCSYLFSHLVGDNYWLRPKSPKRRIGCITSVSTIDIDCRVYTLVSVLHPKDYPINLFANIIFKNWYKLIFLTIKSFWMLEFIGIRSCLLFLLSCLWLNSSNRFVVTLQGDSKFK